MSGLNKNTRAITLDAVVSRISKLRTSLQRVKEMSGKIGTIEDSSILRNSVKQDMTELASSCQQLAEQLNSLKKMSTPADSLSVQRVDEEAHELFNQIKSFIPEVKRKLQSTVQHDATNSFSSSSSYQNPYLTSPFSVEQQQQEQVLKQIDSSIEQRGFDLSQREDQLDSIEQDVVLLNSMFKDFLMIAEEQDELIDHISTNIKTSVSQVEAGVANTIQAQQYQKKGNNKTLCIAIVIIVILILAVLAAVIGFTF
eukprot:TRINITY_DN5244_c0_g1_i1.p1 TRINITY_DN5244_c0_g1~~TRINITY_DN5244_c0_g1_i1.p1  ORF type:complete len:273 (-),score=120.42 TRINITY_DN5244_c0_g1_i1:156-920(-)